jgi:hypothetical protein
LQKEKKDACVLDTQNEEKRREQWKGNLYYSELASHMFTELETITSDTWSPYKHTRELVLHNRHEIVGLPNTIKQNPY